MLKSGAVPVVLFLLWWCCLELIAFKGEEIEDGNIWLLSASVRRDIWPFHSLHWPELVSWPPSKCNRDWETEEHIGIWWALSTLRDSSPRWAWNVFPACSWEAWNTSAWVTSPLAKGKAASGTRKTLLDSVRTCRGCRGKERMAVSYGLAREGGADVGSLWDPSNRAFWNVEVNA